MSGINDFQVTENFNLSEFECTHPTHWHVLLSKDLVEKLQELRDYLGEPLHITSGYRCSIRNKQVGGTSNSQHLHGRAADISLHTIGRDISQIGDISMEIGFTGIGYYSNFIHLDVRPLPDHQDAIIWDGR